MQSVKRVFAIGFEICPDCGGKTRVIACIEDPPLFAQILGRPPSPGRPGPDNVTKSYGFQLMSHSIWFRYSWVMRVAL